ncbi:MAG: hypothetical protein A2390_01600 [Candidatus Liptonbacteria bacterium RIFOXYB1_FULL_36_10]|uniref:Uncharacterized protein n=2 Tax=Candidatus Liptoniibacteriota TaxID=1817909 RepID=A0A1G2CLQ0_9BACT|nr:MAG: hypothetical protein A2390_01600 [Candidatus Liptonbacteria bacterium RIFOXYB1_FULL_36_10]OGZ03971.1 MAG: hypothetical protein A2604_02795 [Candidatus Liptonbacteria bacterium RIFOXYD1_FULL_36_11]
MKKKLIFSVIVVIIAGAGVLGYLEYKKNRVENPGGQTTGINTSDWLTYRNDEYGFELKMPKNWGELSTYDGGWSKLDLLKARGLIFVGDEENSNGISLDIDIDNKNFNSVDDYIPFVLGGYEIVKKENLLTNKGRGQLVDVFYKDLNNIRHDYSFFFFERLSGVKIMVWIRSSNDLGNKVASSFGFID